MSKMKRIEQIARKLNIVDAAKVALNEKKIRRAVETAKDKVEEAKINAQEKADKIMANFSESIDSTEAMTRAISDWAKAKCEIDNADATLKFISEFEAALEEDVEVEDEETGKKGKK